LSRLAEARAAAISRLISLFTPEKFVCSMLRSQAVSSAKSR
jgi:hypothetical protein